MNVEKLSNVRPRMMAHHALRCRACKGNVALLVNSTNHLAKLEAMASIEWCTFRKEGRRAHA